ncbi:MAG: hypothetical protein M5U28_22810 [Sandaracinaceae bacterium]|nr:hypothetical protein [Sandaracinaceae bacterium]
MSRKHLWKRWRKWAFVLAIFAVGIPLSTALAVRSSGSRARLHALAAGAIHDELGLDARIGTVSLQLVPFTLVARDITLDDPVYGRFAEADELRIRPSLRALLRGAVDIDGIEIRGASLRLVVRNGQIRNLPRAEGQGGAGGPTLPFDELRVVRSTLTIDAEPHASGQLRGVDVTVRGEDSTIVVEARSSGGWARHRRGRERLESPRGAHRHRPESLRVDRLAVRTPEASVELTSALLPLPFREHGYSGHVAVSYDLSHLARLPLPEGVTLPPMEGRVDVDAELSTADREQRAEGTVTLAGVRIEQFGIGETGDDPLRRRSAPRARPARQPGGPPARGRARRRGGERLPRSRARLPGRRARGRGGPELRAPHERARRHGERHRRVVLRRLAAAPGHARAAGARGPGERAHARLRGQPRPVAPAAGAPRHRRERGPLHLALVDPARRRALREHPR